MSSRPAKTPCGITHTASSVKSAAKPAALSSVKAVLSCMFNSPRCSSARVIAGKIARKTKHGCGKASAKDQQGEVRAGCSSLQSKRYNAKAQLANVERLLKSDAYGTVLSTFELTGLSRPPFQLILWQWKIQNRHDPAAAVTSRSPSMDVEDRFL